MGIEQQATPADPRVAGVENLLADYNAIAAEEGTEPIAAEEPKPAEAKPDKPAEKQAEKPNEEPKKPEGKKTAAQYAADRIAAKNARIAEREAQLTAKETELAQKIAEAAATSPAKLKELADLGNADDLAKLIGFKDWNDLNDHFAQLYASPGYKRQRALEQKVEAAEREKAELKAAQDAERLRQQEAQQWADAQAETADALKASDDPVMAKFGEDEGFCAEVLRRVVASRGEKDVPEAAQEVLDGIVERARRWQEVLGDRLTVKAETAQAGTPTRPGSKQVAKPQKHVSRQSATEAANPLPKEMTDAEWKAYATEELAKSWREQQEQERRERAG